MQSTTRNPPARMAVAGASRGEKIARTNPGPRRRSAERARTQSPRPPSPAESARTNPARSLRRPSFRTESTKTENPLSSFNSPGIRLFMESRTQSLWSITQHRVEGVQSARFEPCGLFHGQRILRFSARVTNDEEGERDRRGRVRAPGRAASSLPFLWRLGCGADPASWDGTAGWVRLTDACHDGNPTIELLERTPRWVRGATNARSSWGAGLLMGVARR